MSDTALDEPSRAAILQAGKRVFQRWGPGKTTMEDIAREAGKGKSTLYYYYKNRDEIFTAVIRMELAELLSRAKDSLQDTTSARERLRKYIVASCFELTGSIPLSEILRREVETDPKFLKKTGEQFQPAEEEFLQDILALGVQQNHFSFANDQELASTANLIFRIVASLQLGILLGNFEIKDIEAMARLIVNGV